jgi:hypothetical protein
MRHVRNFLPFPRIKIMKLLRKEITKSDCDQNT